MAQEPVESGPRLPGVAQRAWDRQGARLAGSVLTVALLLMVIVSAGCSAGSALVGEWHVDGAGQKIVQFSNDGRFESTCLGLRQGTFEVTDGGKAVEFKGEGKSETLALSVAGSTLNLSGSLADGTHVQWAMSRAASSVRPVK